MPLYHFRIGKRLLYLVQQTAERKGIPVSWLIRRALLEYLRNLPLEYLFANKLGLKDLFNLLQQFALTYRIAGIDVTTRREAMIQTLTERIDELSGLIRTKKTAKETMLRQYQLLGYLCSILNGILEDVATDELIRRIDEAKTFVETKQKHTNADGRASHNSTESRQGGSIRQGSR